VRSPKLSGSLSNPNLFFHFISYKTLIFSFYLYSKVIAILYYITTPKRLSQEQEIKSAVFSTQTENQLKHNPSFVENTI